MKGNKGGGRGRPDTGPLRIVTMQLDPRDVRKLDDMARKAGVSRQAYIRALLREWVQEFRDYPLRFEGVVV